MLRFFVLFYDFFYRLFHGLLRDEARAGDALLIEIHPYRGEPKHLRDGAVIQRGDIVGVIHLNNRYVTSLHARAAGLPGGAKQQLRDDIIRAYSGIVRELSGPRYKNVAAFMGSTIFAREEAEKFSFELIELPDTVSNRLASLYARLLIRVFHPRGRKRAAELRGRRIGELWISREGLRKQYGVQAPMH